MFYVDSNGDQHQHRLETPTSYYTYDRPPERVDIISIVCLVVFILVIVCLCISACARGNDNDDELEMEQPRTRFIIFQTPLNARTSDHFAQLGPNQSSGHRAQRGEIVYPPPYDGGGTCPPEFGRPPGLPPYSRYVQPQNVQPPTPSAPPLYTPSQ